MLCLWGTTLLFIAVTTSEGVQVNMIGSLSLGKDVVNVLSNYVKENMVDETQDARRTLSDSEAFDVEPKITNKHLCRNLSFCDGKYEKIINEYVVSLHDAIADVFEGTVQKFTSEHNLKRYVRIVKKILKHANSSVTGVNDVYVWTDVFKKISSSFIESTILFVKERLKGPKEVTDKVNRILIQQIVLAVVNIELEYQSKLCTTHNICANKFTCTKSLHIVLGQLDKLDITNVRKFVKAFHESIHNAPAILRLDVETREEFENILVDMTEANDTPAMKILLSVKEVVEKRLERDEPKVIDALLIHTILSDMDHAFYKEKYPFEDFLGTFDNWVKGMGEIEPSMKRLIKDMTNHLLKESSKLTFKLMEEVKVFLELTVSFET